MECALLSEAGRHQIRLSQLSPLSISCPTTPPVLPNVLHYHQHGPVIADASLALPGHNEEIRFNYFVFGLTWLNWSFNGTNFEQYVILVQAIMHDVYVMHKCK